MRAIFLLLMFLVPVLTFAGNEEEVVFKSSINCNMCKSKIEKELPLSKGVKSVSVDVEAKTITVKFSYEKTSIEKLKKAINKIGYDADETLADQKAHDRLPKCCQKSEKCNH